MKILTTNSGSYPRVGDEPGQMRLRKAYQKWEVGEISDKEMEEIYQEYTKEVIEEQEKAGLDIVTDGQLRWYDPLSHFAKNIHGCQINGLLRYFDTNFYFRQPVVKDDLVWKTPTVKEEFLSAKEHAKASLKPVITGPFTLAWYSIDESYGNFSDLVLDFADVLAREVEELVEAGAEEIQVDEPAILGEGEEFEVFSQAFEVLAGSKNGCDLDLYVYFGDSAPLYERFLELPADLVGLDFTYSPDLPGLIEEMGSNKPLGLGLVDARNTKMETKEDIIPVLEKIVPHIDADKIYLNPSTGVEYLPRKRAYEKLENMVEIAKEAGEVVM